MLQLIGVAHMTCDQQTSGRWRLISTQHFMGEAVMLCNNWHHDRTRNGSRENSYLAENVLEPVDSRDEGLPKTFQMSRRVGHDS